MLSLCWFLITPDFQMVSPSSVMCMLEGMEGRTETWGTPYHECYRADLYPCTSLYHLLRSFWTLWNTLANLNQKGTIPVLLVLFCNSCVSCECSIKDAHPFMIVCSDIWKNIGRSKEKAVARAILRHTCAVAASHGAGAVALVSSLRENLCSSWARRKVF